MIVLVITVVILIILATISINFAFGENGLIAQAQKAKEMTEEKNFREVVALERSNYSLGEKINDANAKKTLYDNLKRNGYKILDTNGNEITSSAELDSVLEIIVEYNSWQESITIEKSKYFVSNEEELADVLQEIYNNLLENKPITAIDSFEINNEQALKDIEFIINENITLTVNAKIELQGNSKVIGTNKENSIIRRGDSYKGTVISGGNAKSINLSNLTLQGNGAWTGEADEILNRGTTYTKELANSPIFNIEYGSTSCNITMDNVVIRDCSTNQTGGNVYFGRPGTINITNCSFIDNNSGDDNNSGSAGTIWITQFPTVTFSNCTFSGNSSFGTSYHNGGGAIRIQNGYVTIEDSTFENNGAFNSNYGGAIYFVVGELFIDNSEFNHNYAPVGAAIRVNEESFSISNTSFTNNISYGVGCVLSSSKPGVRYFSNCEFVNNECSASSSEGGIFWASGVTLNDCTIKSNLNRNIEHLSEALFLPAITIEGGMQIEGNQSSDGTTTIDTNIYVGDNFKAFNISGKLTKENSIHINVDDSIQNVVVANAVGYVLTEEDVKAFVCDNSNYEVFLNTTDNVIEIRKK